MGHVGKSIAGGCALPVMLSEQMLKGIARDRAARLPSAGGKTIQTNHPTWVYGHLSLYLSRTLDVLGKPVDRWAKPEGWEELFKAGSECKDDPDGTIYPDFETVSSFFLNGYKHVVGLLAEVDDEVFAKQNPAEGRMRELMPTVGGLVTFLMTSHPMMHLGQVSAWRRFEGLGSAL